MDHDFFDSEAFAPHSPPTKNTCLFCLLNSKESSETSVSQSHRSIAWSTFIAPWSHCYQSEESCHILSVRTHPVTHSGNYFCSHLSLYNLFTHQLDSLSTLQRCISVLEETHVDASNDCALLPSPESCFFGDYIQQAAPILLLSGDWEVGDSNLDTR